MAELGDSHVLAGGCEEAKQNNRVRVLAQDPGDW